MWQPIETIPHFQPVEVYCEEFERCEGGGSSTNGISICSYQPATDKLPAQFIETTGLVMLWPWTHWRYIRPNPKQCAVHDFSNIHQWFKNGDHPNDYVGDEEGLEDGEPKVFTGAERKANNWEGSVVRYFRHPDVPGDTVCDICGHLMDQHGWIDHGNDGPVVCPGDYIVESNGYYTTIKQHSIGEYITKLTNPIFSHSFQKRVTDWLNEAFGELFPEIIECKTERNHRFLEEALELVQSCDMSKEEAMALVHYVYSRPVGEKFQEVGGVSTTLCALCTTHGINVVEAAETELHRDYVVIDKIRYKQGLKPKFVERNNKTSVWPRKIDPS